MRFKAPDEFLSSTDDAECFPIRCLFICAMQIGISARRRVVFRAFGAIYALLVSWHILLVGRRWGMFPHTLFVDLLQEDRNI